MWIINIIKKRVDSNKRMAKELKSFREKITNNNNDNSMNFLKQLFELVDGLKTYIVLVLGLIGVILWSQQVLDSEAFTIWMSICGLGTAAGFRDALNK